MLDIDDFLRVPFSMNLGILQGISNLERKNSNRQIRLSVDCYFSTFLRHKVLENLNL